MLCALSPCVVYYSATTTAVEQHAKSIMESCILDGKNEELVSFRRSEKFVVNHLPFQRFLSPNVCSIMLGR